jgi:hypothetical protein
MERGNIDELNSLIIQRWFSFSLQPAEMGRFTLNAALATPLRKTVASQVD